MPIKIPPGSKNFTIGGCNYPFLRKQKTKLHNSCANLSPLSTKRIELKHIVVPYNKRGKKFYRMYSRLLHFPFVSYSSLLPTIITPIGKLFVHSTFFFVAALVLWRLSFMLAALHIESFYIPKNYGPTSCFFFTLNTLIYTVIICAHAIHTKRFWKNNIFI